MPGSKDFKWRLSHLALGLLLAATAIFGLRAVSQAQVEELLVNINQVVTAEKFPQVTAFVTVLDANGLPQVGLTRSNFQVIANDRPVPEAVVTVESDTTQELAVVLALDLSLDRSDDLDQIKKAATAFLDSLGPQDYLVIITFYDKVEEIFRGPADDQKKLNQLIAGLKAKEGRTAFYEAARQSVEALTGDNNAPTGRRAVVILTNIGNNIESGAAERAKVVVERSPIPINVISFGSRAKMTELEALARRTQGQAFRVLTVDDLPITLQRLGVLQRQGYRVAFQPKTKPGADKQYDFSIQVITPQGKRGQARANFELEPAQSKIKLFGLRNLYPGEVMTITAEVDTPAPTELVTYQIGQEAVMTVTTPPYQFVWPSQGKAPGDFALSVSVVDLAGNQAMAQASFQVTEPPPPATKIYWGDELALEAGLQRPAAGTVVEFWLEDKMIGRVITSPYRFVFTSTHPLYPPEPETSAQYVVKRRIISGADGKLIGETRHIVEFVRRPEPLTLGWPEKISIVLMLVGNFFILPLLAVVWSNRRKKKLQQLLKSCRLKIKNLGNVPSPFQVSAKAVASTQGLQFQLQEVFPERVMLPEIRPAGEIKPQKAQSSKKSEQVVAPAGGGNGIAGSLQQKKAQGQQMMKKAGGAGNTALEILEMISGIPYVGKPLRGIAGSLRRQQAEARYLASMPQQFARPVKQISSKLPQNVSSKVKMPNLLSFAPGQATPAGQPNAGPQQTPPDWESAPVAAAVPEAAPAPMAKIAMPPAPTPAVSAWSPFSSLVTSSIEPGQVLTIELLTKPLAIPRRAESYKFQVASHPISGEDEQEQVDKTLAGRLEIMGISWWYRSFGWGSMAWFMVVADILWLFGLLYIMWDAWNILGYLDL